MPTLFSFKNTCKSRAGVRLVGLPEEGRREALVWEEVVVRMDQPWHSQVARS